MRQELHVLVHVFFVVGELTTVLIVDYFFCGTMIEQQAWKRDQATTGR